MQFSVRMPVDCTQPLVDVVDDNACCQLRRVCEKKWMILWGMATNVEYVKLKSFAVVFLSAPLQPRRRQNFVVGVAFVNDDGHPKFVSEDFAKQ